MNRRNRFHAQRRFQLAASLGAITCWLGLSALTNTPALAAEPKPERIVVLVSVDGLAAFYMDDPKAQMPTLRALAAAGARSPMKSSAPTVTWPNHTNLVTGTTSARHGVVGNDYFDREQQKQIALILDPEFDKEQIVRVPTIYDAAHAAGLKSAAVRWPATRNARSLDWTVPEVGDVELLHSATTPVVLAECRAAGIWADGDVEKSKGRELRLMNDETGLAVFNHILKKHRPNLALLHLVHVDSAQHRHGPRSPEAYAAIEHADAQLGQIWEILKRDFAGAATLVVVSDHGFSRIEHTVLPNVVLRNLGLCTVEGDTVTGGPVRVVIQGGAAFVYVLDSAQRSSIIERLRKFFAATQGIAKVAGPGQLKDHGVAEPAADPHAPDMILFAADGYGFGDQATGDAAVVESTELKGTHGHDEHMPILYATFVAWGSGIKPGTKLELVNNTDVAPTIAKLMGLELPRATGKVIDAALGE
jgi:predicted AlkP superfamily pyrophosphatase or phosphodiesterase